jgi:hypothetical protein
MEDGMRRSGDTYGGMEKTQVWLGNPKERDNLEDFTSTGGQLEEIGWHNVDLIDLAQVRD